MLRVFGSCLSAPVAAIALASWARRNHRMRMSLRSDSVRLHHAAVFWLGVR